MLKLIDQQNRGRLIEGKRHGLGFAMAKRVDDTIVLVDPLSPCKDFNNDRIYSEMTGKECGAWGLKCKREDIFLDEVGYLIIGICLDGAKTLRKYDGYDKEVVALEKNFHYMQLFINWFDHQWCAGQTRIEKLEDNRFLCTIPLFWVEATYRISLLGLLLRAARFWDGSEPMDYLKTAKNDETMNINTVMPKIERMLDGQIPVQDFTTSIGIHDLGISNYLFPKP